MLENILNNGALASWIQALIYLLTLFVLYRQLTHLRKQSEAQNDSLKLQIENNKYSNYIRCQSDFTQLMRQLLQGDLHEKIYNSLYKAGKTKFKSEWTNYTEDDKKVYAFFEIVYELVERVYCIKLYDDDDKIIDELEWKHWENWIDDIVGHPLFEDVHEDSLGMYDKGFEELISNKIISIKQTD